jgi:NAD(P)-dependent dehydrogenase (short-subunit alcohol dehydrogenase family)
VCICIIGGSSSLGLELIRQAENRQEKIVATYHLKSFNTQAKLVHLNLLNKDQICTFQPQNIRHLIFAQGLLPGKTLGEYEYKVIEETIAINLTSTLQIINNLIINQCFKNPALITFVSSIAALQGSYDTAYATSKSGQIGCAKSIAKHHAPRLRANVICPGMLQDSGMYNSMSVDDQLRHINQTPTKALTSVEHLAEIILNLDNKCFSNLNGAVINLNGGRYV